MTVCNSCVNEISPEWKLCPFCGAIPTHHCACGKIINPEWKLCPFCGVMVAHGNSKNREANYDSNSLCSDKMSASWQLHTICQKEFMLAFEEIEDAVRDAKKLSTFIAAQDHTRIENAFSIGLRRISALESDMRFPESFRRSIQIVLSRKTDFQNRLAIDISGLAQMVRELEALNLPETTVASLISGAAAATDSNSAAGIGLLGGAAIGSILLPGI